MTAQLGDVIYAERLGISGTITIQEIIDLLGGSVPTVIKDSTITATTNAALLPETALADRINIIISNEGDESVRYGDSTITSTKGILLRAGETHARDIDGDIYIVSVSGTPKVSIQESA